MHCMIWIMEILQMQRMSKNTPSFCLSCQIAVISTCQKQCEFGKLNHCRHHRGHVFQVAAAGLYFSSIQRCQCISSFLATTSREILTLHHGWLHYPQQPSSSSCHHIFVTNLLLARENCTKLLLSTQQQSLHFCTKKVSSFKI